GGGVTDRLGPAGLRCPVEALVGVEVGHVWQGDRDGPAGLGVHEVCSYVWGGRPEPPLRGGRGGVVRCACVCVGPGRPLWFPSASGGCPARIRGSAGRGGGVPGRSSSGGGCARPCGPASAARSRGRLRGRSSVLTVLSSYVRANSG